MNRSEMYVFNQSLFQRPPRMCSVCRNVTVDIPPPRGSSPNRSTPIPFRPRRPRISTAISSTREPNAAFSTTLRPPVTGPATGAETVAHRVVSLRIPPDVLSRRIHDALTRYRPGSRSGRTAGRTCCDRRTSPGSRAGGRRRRRGCVRASWRPPRWPRW